MTQLKLITFDLDNTLWPMDELIRQAEKTSSDWIAEHYPSAATALTAKRIRAVRDQLVRQHPEYLNNLTRLRRDAMSHAFMDIGFGEKEARDIAADAFQVFHQARNQVTFFPGAIETLETLSDRYILGALSNGNADLKRIGIRDLFGFHHSSESIGRRKPDPDMFDAALRSAGVRPEQALHVGDHPVEDVDAARQHGFHAVWANLVDLHWPDDIDRPPHRIHQLNELTDLLPRL